MSTLTGREIQLARRPTGLPTPDTFRLVEAEVPEPGPGELLVRNRFISVDPYMRGRMDDRPSYVPPFRVGTVMEGGAVGEVIAANERARRVPRNLPRGQRRQAGGTGLTTATRSGDVPVIAAG
jgi:NADPH-dependent curcumin reductase CurA